ncbi:MAG: protein kinase [Acidobacteriota bacterium]
MRGDFRLGQWLVQPQLNRVSSSKQSTALEPKMMELLVYLAHRHPEVVSKDRLIHAAWPDSHVGDEALTSSIYKLRQALDDDPKDPQFIQTVHRRGYRLIAEVFPVESESRYHLLESLGRGAMGEVRLAEDRLLKRKVALKFVLEDKEEEPKWVARLEREALAAAALDHPFICKVYETGELEGRTFLAMEYVEGQTLTDRLSGGPLPILEALKIVIEIAEALEVAHDRGIVHRDLKPSNIILTAQGHVKITDFGVAKWLPAAGQEPSEQIATLTLSMSTSGTVPYMSPEQVTGRPVDPRSDIFALGVLLYEMLSGVNPFQKQLPMETAAAIQHETPAPLAEYRSDASELLEYAVRKILAKDPAKRYQSAHELRTDLEAIPPRPGPPRPISRSPKRRALLQVLPWVLAPLVGLLVWFWRPPMDRAVLRAELTMPEGERFQSNYRQGIALSPDGSYLAFTAGTRESMLGVEPNRLYLRRLDQRSSLLVPDSDLALNPVFSPDSQWLVFGTRRATREDGVEDPPRLRKIPVTGGDAQTLCECSVDFGLSWGPAGIVFSPGQLGPLEMIQDNGSDRRTITELDAADFETSHRLPAFLPDGRLIFTAFRTTSPRTRIYVYSLETEEKIPLLDLDDAWQARYVPTGHLVFARHGDLLAAPFDLDSSTITGPEVLLIEGVYHSIVPNTPPVSTGASQYSFSSTGLLAYVPGGVLPEEKDHIVSVTRQGEVQVVPVEPRQYISVRVSPDSRSLLLTTNYPPAKVWLYNLRTGKSLPQTFESIESKAIFGPGKEHFTFVTRAGGPIEYRKRKLGSGADVRAQSLGLTSNAEREVLGMEWSPDGQTAAVVVRTPASTAKDIWIWDVEKGLRPWHTPTPGVSEQGPTFSPNGEWLAYYSNRFERDQIYIRSISGGDTPILVSPDGGISPVWSRDGTELYYRNSPGFYGVSIAEGVDGLQVGEPVKLFEGRYWSSDVARYYDVDRDGRFYLVKVQENEQRQEIFDRISPRKVHLVYNWFEELKRLAPSDH